MDAKRVNIGAVQVLPVFDFLVIPAFLAPLKSYLLIINRCASGDPSIFNQ